MSDVTAALVRHWIDTDRLTLPLPGSGGTTERWRRLASLAEEDLVAARIAEAHSDAVAILHELGGSSPSSDQLWGVWAAEARDISLTATTDTNGAVILDGVKPWCSGAGFCSHALVTAALRDSAEPRRGLFAVALESSAVTAQPSTWSNVGMAGADTRAVQFTGAPAVVVGKPGDYLERPGFWHGAVGVAACWLGGARRVAETLYCRCAEESTDPHMLAHLGAVDAALAAGQSMLTDAGAHIDRDPFDRTKTARLLALRVRTVVEHAADEAISRTGRALGPGPLSQDGPHAQRVADLTLYIRQSHAEKDLAQLGQLAATHYDATAARRRS